MAIDFNDEHRVLFWLFSVSDSWDGMVTAASGLSGDSKLMFKGTCHLIFGKEVCKNNASVNSSGSLLSTYGKGRRSRNGQSDRGRSRFKK